MNLQEKLNKSYVAKSVSFKMEDVDEANRIVKGYFSAFDKLDSDYDIIRKGAFAKSIMENGPKSSSNRKIAHLRNHDWNQQIGKLTELEEDEYGLKFVSQLGRSTKGNDALMDYQDGIINEHSIGFMYVQDKLKWVEDSSMEIGGYWEVTEVKLFEGSAVTFGANEFTPVLEAIKSGKKDTAIDKLNQMENAFIKALKRGSATDERYENLEARFKQIQEIRNSLFTVKPSLKDTKTSEKPNNTRTINTFYQNQI